MASAVAVYSNNATTTVTSGGTTAPAPGTVETWTVASSASFPAASNTAAPPTFFAVADPALAAEKVYVTNISGASWTVTRGAEGTTPVAHSPGFTVDLVVTAGIFSLYQQQQQAMYFRTAPSGVAVGGTGGTITASDIAAAQSTGAQGMFLDPRFVWNASGLVIDGIENFLIESRMMGSIGWTANTDYNTQGFISAGTGADGIQMLATSPAGNPTQGVIFKNCVIAGTNSNATVHLGGGQRRCGLVDTLVVNSATAAGSYGVQVDTALSNNNSENSIFVFTGGGGVFGGYGAVGLGLGDQTQHSNDTLWDGLVTSGGTYSINAANASNHVFNLWYDRSNPTTANVLNSAGILTFFGGEDLNNSGLTHQVTGGTTIIYNRTSTAGGASISSGALEFQGRCRLIGTVAMTGGTVDMSSPNGSWSSATVTGTTGVLLISSFYSPGSAPVHSGFSGTLKTLQIT